MVAEISYDLALTSKRLRKLQKISCKNHGPATGDYTGTDTVPAAPADSQASPKLANLQASQKLAEDASEPSAFRPRRRTGEFDREVHSRKALDVKERALEALSTPQQGRGWLQTVLNKERHNDGVWAKTRFISGSLFYGFVGPELAFLTSPRRGLSQKVAALILCLMYI